MDTNELLRFQFLFKFSDCLIDYMFARFCSRVCQFIFGKEMCDFAELDKLNLLATRDEIRSSDSRSGAVMVSVSFCKTNRSCLLASSAAPVFLKFSSFSARV